MNNEYEQLIQLIKSSQDSKVFLQLLQRVIEKVSDVRTLVVDKETDTIQLRNGIIKVIESLLIKPLSNFDNKKIKKFDNTDYN